MKTRSLVAALAAVLAASAAPAAYAEPVFNRIASFAVADNLPDGTDPKTPTSSEIIAATEDGNTLVYSDSPLKAIGFIDITDAKAPKAGGTVSFDGEPTSVTVVGGKALVAVNTRESFVKPSGLLAVVDIATKKIETTCDLGGQPDSIALNKDKTIAAIAIENERDEEVNDGAIPQMPAGDLVIVSSVDHSGQVHAFEEQVGSHGGIGGQQNEAVLLHPADLPLDTRAPLVGAEAVHEQLVAWMRTLGVRP